MSKEKKTIESWGQPKSKEKKKLSEKELQEKNINDYIKIESEVLAQFNDKMIYIDKGWFQFRIEGEGNKIIIYKNKFEYNKSWKFNSATAFSRVELQFTNWQFYVYTRTLNDKTNIQNDKWIKLKSSEVWEYLKAIKNRMTECKKAIKEQFINLSVNEDKKEADNLIESIEEQTT